MRLRHLREELEPGRLVPHLTAGFISGVIAMVVSISFAALIFSGPLADRVGNGIGLMSSFPISLAGPQDSPAAILASVAAALVSSLATASRRRRASSYRAIDGRTAGRKQHVLSRGACLTARRLIRQMCQRQT
jgi:MFS family permease